MTSAQDAVRAAVQLALRNDVMMESDEAKRPAAVKDTGPSPGPSTGPSPGPSPEQKKTKEGKKTAPKRKQNKKLSADSNWKALQKSLGKGVKSGKRSAKRPRAHSADETTSTSTSNVPKAADAKFSSFMKRRVTSTDEVSRVVAIDCEMVGIGPGGKENALARVSMVNYSGDVLYDTFVRVRQVVTDYRTEFSGVRAADVAADAAEATELFEVQRTVGELMKGRVVVGHAIRNDLQALRLKHPWKDIRDTSEFYKRMWRRTKGRRSARGPALRVVVASVLGVDAFQKDEHDSCEDARAALMLYKKNAKAWETEIREKGLKGGKKKKR